MSKNIKLAKNAGFCYGVKRAVETTKKLKQENPN
ncbi:4-hydroxy-3-methylbut-2-enyl diphosphate reductase, partial [bacterium]|nr:4-hydroxy-3-methylbut-2-enyl diphosphate reductase [bacterium]